jgi:hypothetical protein
MQSDLTAMEWNSRQLLPVSDKIFLKQAIVPAPNEHRAFSGVFLKTVRLRKCDEEERKKAGSEIFIYWTPSREDRIGT